MEGWTISSPFEFIEILITWPNNMTGIYLHTFPKRCIRTEHITGE